MPDASSAYETWPVEEAPESGAVPSSDPAPAAPAPVASAPVAPSPVSLDRDDPAVTTAIDVARGALEEITRPADVGAFVDLVDVDDSEGVYLARFANTLPGYPGWMWVVALVRFADQDEPRVLECGLLPDEGALLAPEWIPWAQRLAQYRAEHTAAATPRGESGEGPRAIALARRERRRVRTRVSANGETTRQVNGVTETDGAAGAETAGSATDAQAIGAPDAAAGSSADRRDIDASGGDTERADGRAEGHADGRADGRAEREGARTRERSRRTLSSPRRRVTIAGRLERESARMQSADAAAAAAAAAANAADDGGAGAAAGLAGAEAATATATETDTEFVEAVDVREFADDMDDVFDGVDFEDDNGDDEAAPAE